MTLGTERHWICPTLDPAGVGSGTTCNDLAGGNDGTLQNVTYVIDTEFGGSHAFDSPGTSGSRVFCPNPEFLFFDDSVAHSVTAWIKLRSYGNGSIATIYNITSQTTRDAPVYFGARAGPDHLVNFEKNNINYPGGLADNTWHFVAYTHAANAPNVDDKFYIDGVLQTPTIDSGFGRTTASNAGTSIGAGNATNHQMDGLLDDVRLHDAELSQAQITELWNGGRGYERVAPTVFDPMMFQVF